MKPFWQQKTFGTKPKPRKMFAQNIALTNFSVNTIKFYLLQISRSNCTDKFDLNIKMDQTQYCGMFGIHVGVSKFEL